MSHWGGDTSGKVAQLTTCRVRPLLETRTLFPALEAEGTLCCLFCVSVWYQLYTPVPVVVPEFTVALNLIVYMLNLKQLSHFLDDIQRFQTKTQEKTT